MNSITFLERAAKARPQPIYVLHGDEAFLKRQVIQALRKLILGPDDDGFALSNFAGDKATWPVVLEELQTLPFLVKRRLVVVDVADPFVSRERERLEKYFAATAARPQPPSGVLVLDVKTWASNTKLAKATPEGWLITCDTPESAELIAWCGKWCESQYGKQMTPQAARMLVQLVAPEMGLLDQEIQKLASFAGDAPRIDNRDVDALVGNSRAAKAFDIFTLIGNGQATEALTFLERLLDGGEDPNGLVAAFGWTLKRLAQTNRMVAQGKPAGDALKEAGLFRRQEAEQLLRHLGKRRLDRMFEWLIEADSGMKGGSQLPPRVVLERLVVKLARKQ